MSRAVVYVSTDSGNDIRLTQLVVICLTFPRNKTGKARLKFSVFSVSAGAANRSQSYETVMTFPLLDQMLFSLPISYR